MSGGHWNNSHWLIEDEVVSKLKSEMQLIKEIEHELDWGHSNDICLACARLRVVAGLECYFDNYGDMEETSKVLRDRDSYLCGNCVYSEVVIKEKNNAP